MGSKLARQACLHINSCIVRIRTLERELSDFHESTRTIRCNERCIAREQMHAAATVAHDMLGASSFTPSLCLGPVRYREALSNGTGGATLT